MKKNANWGWWSHVRFNLCRICSGISLEPLNKALQFIRILWIEKSTDKPNTIETKCCFNSFVRFIRKWSLHIFFLILLFFIASFIVNKKAANVNQWCKPKQFNILLRIQPILVWIPGPPYFIHGWTIAISKNLINFSIFKTLDIFSIK